MSPSPVANQKGETLRNAAARMQFSAEKDLVSPRIAWLMALALTPMVPSGLRNLFAKLARVFLDRAMASSNRSPKVLMV
jgi:hypothetical protein